MSLLKTLLSVFEKQETERPKNSRIDLVETVRQSRERMVDVKGMSDKMVGDTIEFIESVYEGPMPQCTTMRNGEVVRLVFGAELGFYDFATIVNNFVWPDPSGKRYEVRGVYPLGTATENGAPAAYSNSDLLVYVPAEEQEPDCVYYKTTEGEIRRYQF